MSFLLRPRIGAAEWPALTALVALAAAEALEGLWAAGPSEGAKPGLSGANPDSREEAPWLAAIKWPNDVYGRHGKLGGILAETAGDAVIIGLGLNLTQGPDDFPESLRGRTSSLRMEGFCPVPAADQVARAFDRHLAPTYAAFQRGERAFLRAGLRRRFHLRGARVRVRIAGGTREGWARDVGPMGELLVEVDGVIRPILAGEVTVLD